MAEGDFIAFHPQRGGPAASLAGPPPGGRGRARAVDRSADDEGTHV